MLFVLFPFGIKDFIEELWDIFYSVETQQKITGGDREIAFNYFLDRILLKKDQPGSRRKNVWNSFPRKFHKLEYLLFFIEFSEFVRFALRVKQWMQNCWKQIVFILLLFQKIKIWIRPFPHPLDKLIFKAFKHLIVLVLDCIKDSLFLVHNFVSEF